MPAASHAYRLVITIKSSIYLSSRIKVSRRQISLKIKLQQTDRVIFLLITLVSVFTSIISFDTSKSLHYLHFSVSVETTESVRSLRHLNRSGDSSHACNAVDVACRSTRDCPSRHKAFWHSPWHVIDWVCAASV